MNTYCVTLHETSSMRFYFPFICLLLCQIYFLENIHRSLEIDIRTRYIYIEHKTNNWMHEDRTTVFYIWQEHLQVWTYIGQRSYTTGRY